MRWSRNTLLAVLTISLAFNAGFGTTFAVRTYREQHDDPPRRSGFREFYKSLNLTQEQHDALNATRKQLFSDLRELRRTATREQEQLADLVTASEPDREAVTEQLERAAVSQQRIQERIVEHMLHQKTLLPAEHQAEYDRLIRDRLLRDVREHRHKRKHRDKNGSDKHHGKSC